ncbi:MAG: phosphoenolpyruvate--protein phosphotransferase [Acidithiobacillus sp.]
MNTVGLVLVSHSRALALATETLVRQVGSSAVRIAIAAGTGEENSELGTNAIEIMTAITDLDSPAGTLILIDMGSALLSAETALGLLDTTVQARVRISSGPFVEGAMAAALAASGGGDLERVAVETDNALKMKQSQLTPPEKPQDSVQRAPIDHTLTRHFQLQDPAGLHLRPAAALAKMALARATPTWVEPCDGHREAVSASSLTGMLSLDLRQGDEIEIRTSGADAESTLNSMIALLNTAHAAPSPSTTRLVDKNTSAQKVAQPAAPGIAIGPIRKLSSAPDTVPVTYCTDAPATLKKLQDAIEIAQRQKSSNPILEAQNLLLQDPALLDTAKNLILTEHMDAAPAWAQSIEKAIAVVTALTDPILRARATDIQDVGMRVLQALGIASKPPIFDGPPVILLTNDLQPSVAAQLRPEHILGVIDLRSGASSHAAILLRGAGIPCIVGAEQLLLDQVKTVAMDGTSGEIWLDPDPSTVLKIELRRAQQSQNAEPVESGRILLKDNSTLELWANVASLAEAEAAHLSGAVGIGLLRTEFLFLDRISAPSEEEQYKILTALMLPMAGKPIVIRALDAGADKPLPFLTAPAEVNPALGQRGLRVLLTHPDIFSCQLRAMLRAGWQHDLRIMLPMVTNPTEVVAARKILEQAHQDLQAAGQKHLWPAALGIMAEVPAAALTIDQFSGLADFISIGSNDLTQYTLAIDRNNPALAALGDASHPAVLALCRIITSTSKIPVSLCGEAAGDPHIAPLLVASGIRRLSMSPHALPGIYHVFKNRYS